MSPRPTHYATLRITLQASPKEIDAAYRALRSRHHPDHNPDDEAVQHMAQIDAAYAVLSDPAQRAAYDMKFVQSEHAPRARQLWLPLGLAVLALFGVLGLLLVAAPKRETSSWMRQIVARQSHKSSVAETPEAPPALRMSHQLRRPERTP